MITKNRELIAKCAALAGWDNRILPHYYSGDHLTADGTLALIEELLEADWYPKKSCGKFRFESGPWWSDEGCTTLKRATCFAYLKMKGVER